MSIVSIETKTRPAIDVEHCAVEIGDEGHVYLIDRETGDDWYIGHVDRAWTRRDCPKGLQDELDRLEEEWREKQAERERVGREDRRDWEHGYNATRGV